MAERTVKKKEHIGYYETENTQIMCALTNNPKHFYIHEYTKLDPKPGFKGKN